MKYVCSFLFLVALLGCQSDSEPTVDPSNLLLGSWVNPVYENEMTTYKRAAGLKEQAPGISFHINGEAILRTSGFCGTPPLSFYDESGSWQLNESILHISNLSFPDFINWRIVSLNENQLIVKRELTPQEIDHRALMDLFNELSQLASSTTCEDPNNWLFTAYGSKACGGPQGYIAYPKSIDKNLFLQKIEAYSAAEQAYNIKWSIVSDCALPNEPSGIECLYGFPYFKY